MVHVKPKRPLVPVPFLQGIIDEIVSAQTEKALTAALDRFDSPHHFERPEERNLLNWFKVLNRFDELLERYVSSRNIFASKKQAASSSPSDPATSSAPPAPASAAENSGASSVDAAPPKNSSPASGAASDKGARAFTPSPVLVRLILRLTQRLLRNSSHDTRTVYNSVEHIGALLADDNSAIVLLALEILNMLMQRSHKLRSNRTHIAFELSERLIDMAAGWGGRENRLGMLECCSSKNLQMLPSDGSRLFFEFTKTASGPAGESSETPAFRVDRQPENRAKSSASNVNSRLVVGPIPLPISPSKTGVLTSGEQPSVSTIGSTSAIILENATDFQGDERWLLDFANRSKVPKAKWFSFLSAFRRAKRFGEGRDARIELTIIRLYAITTLFQVQPQPPMLNDLLAKEPEVLQDIVALASATAEDGVSDIPRALRIIAIRCLTAMSSDRHRLEPIMSATGVSAHHGALSTLLRTEISSLLSSFQATSGAASERNGPEAMHMESGPDAQPKSPAGERVVRSSVDLTLFSECNRASGAVQRIHTTEALLSLVHSLAMAAGSSGATPLANSGVLGILIPLLTDRDVRHSRVVAQAIRAMQAIVEGSAQSLGCQMFRDHDGLTLVAGRIAAEIGVDGPELPQKQQEEADEAAEVEALTRRGESRSLYQRLVQRQMTPLEALEHPPPSSGTTSRGQLPHSKWALLRALHTLLLRSLGNGGNEVRELVVTSKLSRALRKIMAQPFLHGGSLFQSAATVTTEIAHAEPTATAELCKAGIATTVLRTIANGLPPCSEVIRCVPNLLAALCLAPSARFVIVGAKPLQPFLLRLATPFYTRALHGESPVHVGASLDELMRHVEDLRPQGNEAMIEYLKLSAKFVECETKSFKRPHRPTGNTNASPQTEDRSNTDATAPTDQSTQSAVSSGTGKNDQDRESPDVVLLDKMKLAVAHNSCRLAGYAQGSTEHQEGIVQSKGLDYMIQLRLAIALASHEASVREGYHFSRHYPTPAGTVLSLVSSLRNFSSRHAASVLKSLFTVIVKDAATVLKISRELGDAWLPEEDEPIINKERMADSGIGRGNRTGSASETKDLEESICVDGDNVQDHESDESRSGRLALRKQLSVGLKKLRVGVVLLSGLSRGGPGSSAGVWETARGSQVAAMIATVERAARYHLAIVYTGLTLSASSDGDLNTARVTAAADPEMKPLRSDLASDVMGDLNKVFGWPVSASEKFKEVCNKYQLPPESHEPVRQEVKGLAWCLVTFAVAAQRLYSTLAKGLSFSSRRLLRDPARYTASAKSLAATIGRIFALHLMAAERLWNVKVITMGDNRVVAAWDYVRGILIEIKGTLFDESRRVTQSLILRAFLDAGGAEALLRATKPSLIVQASSPHGSYLMNMPDARGAERNSEDELDKLLRSKALSVSSYILALRDLFDQLEAGDDGTIAKPRDEVPGDSAIDKEDTVMSSDSVSHQARAISRIVVSEPGSGKSSVAPFTKELVGEELVAVLANAGELSALKEETMRMRDLCIQHCQNVAIRRVASDVWNTLCGFLHLLGACPGLLSSNSSAMPGVAAANNDWEPKDIQRSALTVTLDILQSVMRNPAQLLSSFKPDGSAMTDILGVVHTSTQVAEELCRKAPAGDAGGNGPSEGAGIQRRREQPRPPAPREVDPEMLRSLVEMGFSERRARAALRRTAPGGLEYAAEWLLSHGEEENGSGDDENEVPTRWPDSEQNRDRDSAAGDEGGDGDDEDEGDDDDDQNDGDGEGDIRREGSEEEGNDRSDEDHEITDEQDAIDPTAAQRDPSGASNEGPEEDAMMDTIQANENDRQGRDSDPQRRSQGTRKKRGESDKSSTGDASRMEREERLVLNMEGPRLLTRSMNTELGLLWFALDRSKAVRAVECPDLLASAAFHCGPMLDTKYTDIPDHSQLFFKNICKTTLRVAPISVDSFRMSKKLLFESLLDVTRAVILESEDHTHGRYLPYFAVELLSIVRKDGSLNEEGTNEYASLLDAGLKSIVNGEEYAGSGLKSGLQGQTAAIWSHYGGNHARRALQSSGTLQLAYDKFVSGAMEWTSASKAPRVDIEATQPIRKLSIREDKGTSQVRSGLSIPTRLEAKRLKQLTTCILLLDAMVRYDTKDRIIQCSKEIPKPKEDDSGQIGKDEPEDQKQAERMETDKTGESDAEKADLEETQNKTAAGQDSRDRLSAFHAVLRDFELTSTSAMEIDGRSECDALGLVKSVATATKVKMIESTKEAVSKWMTNEKASLLPSTISKSTVLKSCIALLRAWKRLEVGDAMLAVLQLLGSITSDWSLARAALDQGILRLLLDLPHLEAGKTLSTDYKIVRLLTKTILRHLIEDPDTLREAMESEFRTLLGGGQSRGRPTYSVRSFVMSTAPMAARHMQCYISALTGAVRASSSERRGELQLIDHKPLTTSDIEVLLHQRQNVVEVLSALSSLIASSFEDSGRKERAAAGQSSTLKSKTSERFGLSKFAIDLISEFVEFSQMAAVAFIKSTVSSSSSRLPALDFVLQKILAIDDAKTEESSEMFPLREREELSQAARDLFLALCSKTANTHGEAVQALSRAVKLEADSPVVRAGILAGLAQCIGQGTKMRVLRVLLECDIANDLARSLGNLQLGVEQNFDVAMVVLKALTLISQAATYLARHGDDAGDDISFGSGGGRDPWNVLRERGERLGHSSSFMVL